MRMFLFFLGWTFIAAASAQVQAPKTEFGDYLIAPVHLHRLVTPGELNLTTTLTPHELEAIFVQVNRIWGHAGIHFPIATLTTEPANHPNAYRQNYRSRNLRWMLALRPENTRTPNEFHVYYLKRFLANGVYIGPTGMFVKDMANLRSVEGGIETPIPRVTSHELGHALTLKHRQEVTNLMASGTSGWTLNDAEIKQARDAARTIKWILPAPAILAKADALYRAGNLKDARQHYALIAGIPLHCPEVARAKLRLKPLSQP